MNKVFHWATICTLLATHSFANAQSADEMARKLQNPLANIKAIMTDNAIGFETGDDDGASYGFQIQPIYAIDFPEQGFTFIPRGVIPVLGLEPGAKAPPIGIDGEPLAGGSGSTWGLGDSVVQFFFAPHSESDWKWGIGPQISLRTRTKDEFKGMDWGAGIAGVVTGNITPNLSFAGIFANHWSFDGEFNTATIQPMLYYNIASVSGMSIAYNAPTSIDWKANSSDRWTVPLGLSISRTFDMGGGNGLDLMIGPYYNVARPDGGAKWQLRFGASWLFP